MIEGIQSAVTTAQHLCENQHLDEVTTDFFFEKDGTPKSRVVKLASSQEKGKTVDYVVPLFALIPHGSIRIKEMTVKFKTRLSSVMEARKGGEGRETRTRLGTSVGGTASRWWPFGGKKEQADDMAEVAIVFSATDPPEAIMKLNDELVKRML